MSSNPKIEIKEALGISVGDVVTTSYGSGPYEVKSVRPPQKFCKSIFSIVIRDHEVTSLVLRDLDGNCNTDSYINNIRRVGDRWATDMNDEVFVEKKNKLVIIQPDLFAVAAKSDIPAEYQMQEGCDYRAGAGRIWHCEYCAKDFNSPEKQRLPYFCPDCRDKQKFPQVCVPVFFIAAPPPDDGRPRPSEYNVTQNFDEYLPLDHKK